MKLLWRISIEAKKYRLWIIFAVLSTFCLTAINLAVPKVLSAMTAEVEAGLTSENLNNVFLLAAALAALYLIRILFRFLSNYMAHKPAWLLVEDLRVKLYNHIQSSGMRFFHDRQTGDLMSRVINDTATFEQLFAHLIPETITNIVTLVGVTIIVFSINPQLALMTCIPIPLIIICSRIFVNKIRPLFRKTQESVADLNSRLQDNFTGMHEIQTFSQEERETKNVRSAAAKFSEYNLREMKVSSFFHPSVEFLTAAGNIIIVAFGGWLAYQGSLSIADIVAFMLYIGMFYAPITGLTNLLGNAQLAFAGAERVLAVLDTPFEITDVIDAKSLERVVGDITFDQVNFGYGNEIVLDNISFSVRSGQMVALVGPTGVGKTTVTQLIPRFYEPDAGKITIDGHDINRVELQSLRRNIGMVLQDTFLFNSSVADNISYGRPDAARNEIIAAAKTARIHDDIEAMPDGYDTRVGERGVKLSGGQKQRIAIARAVLCNTPILILDEATASVDVETEQQIQNAISDISGTRTIIAIAHRLSTVRRADLILVLENGRIVQSGNHESLIAQDGLYRRMCITQEQGSRLGASDRLLPEDDSCKK